MSRAARHFLYSVCLTFATLLPQVAAQEPQALLAHLADIESLEGNFTQIRHIAVLAIPLRSSGDFRYQREHGIVWRTTEPIVNEIHITHEQGIVAVDEGGVTRSLPASEVVAGIFLSLFAGELDRLRTYFDVVAVNAATTESLQAAPRTHRPWALRLTPALPTLASQIEYIVVAGHDHVDSVIIQDANGDRSELSLTLTQANEHVQP